jgi:hypothetical protein
MPGGICLPPKIVDKFKQGLISGKISPDKLEAMTSEARHALFSEVVGEGNAKFVNAQFEGKMILKDRQRGYLTWAKKMTGVTPATRRDIISRIERMDKILSPDEEKGFLKDLASTRLGINVSVDEAKHIAELSKRVSETAAKPRSTAEQSLEEGWHPTENDMQYGLARYDLHEHLNNLTADAKSFHLSDLKGKSMLQVAPVVLKKVVDTTKSLGASLDDSFALRQGSKAFWTDNKEWRQQFVQSFSNIFKAAKNSDEARRAITARLMADPQYDNAIRDGLAIKGNEDAFPTSLPEKIPVLGRAFGASEVAYNAFAENLRLELYKKQMSFGAELDSVPKKLRQKYGKNGE